MVRFFFHSHAFQNAGRILWFKTFTRARIMSYYKTKPSTLSRKEPQPPLPVPCAMYLSEHIWGNARVGFNVSPQNGPNAEPETQIQIPACPLSLWPGLVSLLCVSCSLQNERFRLNDSNDLWKWRNPTLWCFLMISYFHLGFPTQ